MSISAYTRLMLISICAGVFLIASVANAFAAGSVVASSAEIVFDADVNDENDVDLSHNGLAYVITDTEPITAGDDCTNVSSTEVSCTSLFGKQITVNTGDGLDRVSVDSTIPASAHVTVNGEADGSIVSAADAVAPIEVNSTAGDITTGSGPDVLVVGSSDYSGTVNTNAGADSLTLLTDLPTATYDPMVEAEPYPNGHAYLNESWPIYVLAGSGFDYIDLSSGEGSMWYEGEGGCDIALGGGSGDWFVGGKSGTGDDTLLGGPGNDTIYSYSDLEGQDMYYGGPGNDKLIMWNNSSEEMFDGGEGIDIISHQAIASAPVSVTLDGLKNDGLSGNDNFTSTVENIGNGGGSPQTITGNANNNYLSGNSGDDVLNGMAGEDWLNGFGGDDTINAQDGRKDKVYCGAGTGDVANVDSVDEVYNCETVNVL